MTTPQYVQSSCTGSNILYIDPGNADLTACYLSSGDAPAHGNCPPGSFPNYADNICQVLRTTSGICPLNSARSADDTYCACNPGFMASTDGKSCAPAAAGGGGPSAMAEVAGIAVLAFFILKYVVRLLL